jgi:hypothetical protein
MMEWLFQLIVILVGVPLFLAFVFIMVAQIFFATGEIFKAGPNPFKEDDD